MANLYVIFFVLALLLFGGIVAYSVAQQRNTRRSKGIKSNPQSATKSSEATDPLIDEDEAQPTNDAALDEQPSRISAAVSAGKKSISSTFARRPKTPRSKAEHKLRDTRAVDEDEPLGVTDERPPSVTADSVEPADEQIEGKPKVDEHSASVVTDLVARVKNPEPIEQRGLLSLFRMYDFKFHRKVHIYGLNQLTDLWRDIEFELPSARFVELGVSIQLADRDGAMSNKELHDFQQMTLEFSNTYDAPFEFSMEIDEALKQAQLLDQIGRRYDSMAVLNVVPKSKAGFRMADIESCARDLMMSADKSGIFMKTQGQKNNVSVLFRLACTDGSGHFGVSSKTMTPVHDLVVYMNVPATQDPEAVFQSMVKDANSLATWLEGKVVDRSGRAMTQRSYSVLMQQISDIAFSMQQDGLTPGDAISKKLF